MVGPLDVSAKEPRLTRRGQTCDFVRRTSLTSRDEDEELHYAIINLTATRLNHKDIFFPDTRQNLDAGLALQSY